MTIYIANFTEEAQTVMEFGHSLKKDDRHMVGQYGNGLKRSLLRPFTYSILLFLKIAVARCVWAAT